MYLRIYIAKTVNFILRFSKPCHIAKYSLYFHIRMYICVYMCLSVCVLTCCVCVCLCIIHMPEENMYSYTLAFNDLSNIKMFL